MCSLSHISHPNMGNEPLSHAMLNEEICERQIALLITEHFIFVVCFASSSGNKQGVTGASYEATIGVALPSTSLVRISVSSPSRTCSKTWGPMSSSSLGGVCFCMFILCYFVGLKQHFEVLPED